MYVTSLLHLTQFSQFRTNIYHTSPCSHFSWVSNVHETQSKSYWWLTDVSKYVSHLGREWTEFDPTVRSWLEVMPTFVFVVEVWELFASVVRAPFRNRILCCVVCTTSLVEFSIQKRRCHQNVGAPVAPQVPLLDPTRGRPTPNYLHTHNIPNWPLFN